MIREFDLTLRTVIKKCQTSNSNNIPKTTSFGCQTQPQDILTTEYNRKLFLGLLKSCARSMLKEGPKKEFCLKKVLAFFDQSNYRYYRPSFDSEKQKLTKTAIELIQKQFVFDEVIKIIEEEQLDVESLFVAAFEKLNKDAQASQSRLSSARGAISQDCKNDEESTSHIPAHLQSEASEPLKSEGRDLNLSSNSDLESQMFIDVSFNQEPSPSPGLQLDLKAVYQKVSNIFLPLTFLNLLLE